MFGGVVGGWCGGVCVCFVVGIFWVGEVGFVGVG